MYIQNFKKFLFKLIYILYDTYKRNSCSNFSDHLTFDILIFLHKFFNLRHCIPGEYVANIGFLRAIKLNNKGLHQLRD